MILGLSSLMSLIFLLREHGRTYLLARTHLLRSTHTHLRAQLCSKKVRASGGNSFGNDVFKVCVRESACVRIASISLYTTTRIPPVEIENGCVRSAFFVERDTSSPWSRFCVPVLAGVIAKGTVHR